MSEKEDVFNIKGLVLRTTDVGESDRMLTVLTAEEGKLSVWARGVRKITNGSLPAAQVFAYANYTLKRGRDKHFLREATIEQTFLGISDSIENTALAAYLCEVADELTYPGGESGELLQLSLNTLWTLAGNKRPRWCVKGAFELRAAAIAGFMPDLSSCCACGAENVGTHAVLDCENGRLFCAHCHEELYIKPRQALPPVERMLPELDETGAPIVWLKIPPSALEAMRYILYTEAKRQFSYTVPEEEVPAFSAACEGYLLHHIGHGYKTLSFYKSMESMSLLNLQEIKE